MTAEDDYDLQRFVDAQRPVIASVLEDLRRGRKRGHWMWFIFPQLKGLGRSSTSQTFAISGIEEATAYLRHPLLGARLRECTQLVNAVHGSTAEDIFGDIDALKFHSCMTLFAKAGPEDGIFLEALKKYYGGELDPLTVALLAKDR